jgi:hypothetical protein
MSLKYKEKHKMAYKIYEKAHDLLLNVFQASNSIIGKLHKSTEFCPLCSPHPLTKTRLVKNIFKD